jgi:hypothetical protein
MPKLPVENETSCLAVIQNFPLRVKFLAQSLLRRRRFSKHLAYSGQCTLL